MGFIDIIDFFIQCQDEAFFVETPFRIVHKRLGKTTLQCC